MENRTLSVYSDKFPKATKLIVFTLAERPNYLIKFLTRLPQHNLKISSIHYDERIGGELCVSSDSDYDHIVASLRSINRDIE